jgi:hypothetical protein
MLQNKKAIESVKQKMLQHLKRTLDVEPGSLLVCQFPCTSNLSWKGDYEVLVKKYYKETAFAHINYKIEKNQPLLFLKPVPFARKSLVNSEELIWELWYSFLINKEVIYFEMFDFLNNIAINLKVISCQNLST